ncbi:MAG: zinc-ribbon domain-containing protein [Sphingobium sp.]
MIDEMILECPNCSTRYTVPDGAIGQEGRLVRCVTCEQNWFEPGPEAEAAVAPADAPSPVQPEIAAPALVPVPPQPVEPDEPPAAVVVETPARRQRRKARSRALRYWGFGALLLALIGAAGGSALWYFGPPGWAVSLGLAADRDQPKLIFYLARQPQRHMLGNGKEYFVVSGRIVNSANEELAVPPLVVELRDTQGRLVFSWITKADKARLKPREEARVSETRLDVPRNAHNVSVSFIGSVTR